jgi:hypothetical protein
MSVVIDGSAGITTNIGAVYNGLQSATAQASTSGTSIDFTSIPSWVKRITVMLNAVSTNGASMPQIQLGVSGTPETTGYNAITSTIFNTANTTRATTSTTGFPFSFASSGATSSYYGQIIFSSLGSNTWTCQGANYNPDSSAAHFTTGAKTLAGTLNMVRITTVGGTDTFDAGSINIIYE